MRLSGDLYEAIPRLERGMAVNRAMQIPPSPALLSFLAYAYTLADRLAEALPLFEQSLTRAATIKFLPCNSLWIGRWGEASLITGCIAEARQHAARARDLPGPAGTGLRSVCPAASRRDCRSS